MKYVVAQTRDSSNVFQKVKDIEVIHINPRPLYQH